MSREWPRQEEEDGDLKARVGHPSVVGAGDELPSGGGGDVVVQLAKEDALVHVLI